MIKVIRSILIIYIIIASFTNAYAQHQFSLGELQILCLKNSNDFETIVLQNGYSYYSEVSSDKLKMYRSDVTNSNGRRNSVSWTKFPNEPIIAGFSTTNKQYYLNLKTVRLTKANGWTFVKEENQKISGKTPSVWYHYTNGKYHVALYSYNIGDEPTWYSIQYYLEP